MRACTAFATTLLLLAGVAHAAAPIPWREAAGHVGEQATIEGDVAATSSTPDQVVLEFAPTDPAAFRVVLIVPLMTNLPRFPERLYQGKRVQVSGLVQRFRGRPEMVLRAPEQIEIVDVAAPVSSPVAAAPARPASPTAPAPAPPPAASAPGVPALLRTPVTPPAAARPAETGSVAAAPATTSTSTTIPSGSQAGPPPRSPVEVLAELRCTRARDRWQEAASHASELAGRLQRCLAAADYRCRGDAAAMAPALSELEWAEQQVADACP